MTALGRVGAASRGGRWGDVRRKVAKEKGWRLICAWKEIDNRVRDFSPVTPCGCGRVCAICEEARGGPWVPLGFDDFGSLDLMKKVRRIIFGELWSR